MLDGKINHNHNSQNPVAPAAVRDGPHRIKMNPGACHSWQLGSFTEENGSSQNLYGRSVEKHYSKKMCIHHMHRYIDDFILVIWHITKYI